MSVWSHAQTITAALPFARPHPRGVHDVVEEVLVPGEGALVLACTFLPNPAPLVVVLHGVSGSSQDHYVVRAARAFLRAGFHVARLNQRGSGLGTGKSRRLGHAGLGEDLALAVAHLSKRDDVTAIGALGYSLGGHLALSHAAELAEHSAAERSTKLRAVVSVSAPVDLHESMRAFDSLRGRFTGVYERRIVASLLERARGMKAFAPEAPFTPEDLARVVTIRDFDAVVTVPSHGFASVDDYYTRASVGPRLGDITVPTLILHAADDPMVPVTALRTLHAAERTSRAIDVVIVPTGGHVGFVEGLTQLWDATGAVGRALAHLKRHLA